MEYCCISSLGCCYCARVCVIGVSHLLTSPTVTGVHGARARQSLANTTNCSIDMVNIVLFFIAIREEGVEVVIEKSKT